MSGFQQAIEKILDGSSMYWMFYHPEERRSDSELVEVRLNATPESVASFVAPQGWELERVQWGDTLFVRRHQSLEREAVEEMLIEMLEFARARRMQLHSWLHGEGAE